MRWYSTVSERPAVSAALEEVVTRIRAVLEDPPDLLLVFASSHHAAAHATISDTLNRAFPGALVVGASARSVIGEGREIEAGPGLSLCAAWLPGVELRPYQLELGDLPAPGSSPEDWRARLGLGDAEEIQILLFADPFTLDVERVLRGLDLAHPGGRVVGGLVSGGRLAGEHALHVSGQVLRAGAVGVALSGAIAMDTIVAQGCRPIGTPLFVTRCEGNLLQELDGRPALEVLQAIHDDLSAADQELFRSSLFVGLSMRESQEYRQGDFLIRNLVGADLDSSSVAIAAHPQRNHVVQFHLRDARTSAEDLDRHLARYRDLPIPPPSGALLFSCLGRGEGLYGQPNHDSDAFTRYFGDVPLTGFFCNGEIGPVQGRTFLHGYTSAFAIFREPAPKS